MKRQLARMRLVGFFTPLGGLQWEMPEREKAVIRELLVFLEDRRVLYAPEECEVPRHCIESVLTIREFLTSILPRLEPQGGTSEAVSAMRRACRDFLNETQASEVPRFGSEHGHWASWRFLPALGKLRSNFGHAVCALMAEDDFQIEDGLRSILPPSRESGC